MLSAAVLENEAARLESLESLKIVDTAHEPRFDELVELAAQLSHAPMAALTLVTSDRQWFKAKVGLAIDGTSRSVAFCAHTINEVGPMVVTDTLSDPRFVDNPLVVNPPYLRFYAGIPLSVDDGLAIGALCVMDTRPRRLHSDERRALAIVGRQVESQLQLHRAERILDLS